MKKKMLGATGVLMASLFAGAAQAEPVQVSACTNDRLTATLTAEVRGTLEDNTPMETLLQTAWTKTINALPSDDLKVGGPNARKTQGLFLNNLLDAQAGRALYVGAGIGIGEEPKVGLPICTIAPPDVSTIALQKLVEFRPF